MSTKRKQWGLQYGLGTLLIVVTAATLLLRAPASRSQHQRQVLNLVQTLDGFVSYEEPPKYVPRRIYEAVGRDFFCDITEIGLNSRMHRSLELAPTDELLRHLDGLSELRTLKVGFLAIGNWGATVHYDETQFTDSGMAHLGRLTQLETLHLFTKNGTNAGMAHLANLTSLKELYLCMPEVTDEGLVHLSELKRIETLYLILPKMSDDGLEYLLPLTELKRLRIDGTGFTDAALDHLSKLSSLQEFALSPNEFSEFGRERLQANLPNARPSRGMNLW